MANKGQGVGFLRVRRVGGGRGRKRQEKKVFSDLNYRKGGRGGAVRAPLSGCAP
jgi:hypothetical protein